MSGPPHPILRSDATSSPASPTERQFWLAEQIAPAAPAHRAIVRIRLDGPVDAAALDQALRVLERRHPALRTAYALENRRVVRRSAGGVPEARRLDLPAGATFEAAAMTLTVPELIDLAEGRIHAIAVSSDADGVSVFVGIHHIAYDGISGEILAADLARAYAAAVEGQALDTAVASRRDQRLLDAGQREQLEEYWRAALDGVPDLPFEGSVMSPRDLFYAKVVEHRELFAPAVMQGARDVARANACSPYGVLLAGYGAALSEVCGATEFCVGTPVSIRSARQADELGCLINVVPIRMRDPGGPQAVKRLWSAAAGAMTHMELSTGDIIRACQPSGSRRMAVYQAMFGYLNWPRTVHDAAGVRVRVVPVRPLGVLAEVQLQLCDTDDGGLEAVVQSPAGGAWAGRLADVVAAFAGWLDAARSSL